jgi:predicted nucleic acid-binding Zn ribbon protein
MAFSDLRSILDTVLKEHNFGDVHAHKVFSQWKELAGPKVAAHAMPVRMNKRILYVEVDDPLWLAQLKYMKGDILNKIDRQIKPDLFADLKFFLKRV